VEVYKDDLNENENTLLIQLYVVDTKPINKLLFYSDAISKALNGTLMTDITTNYMDVSIKIEEKNV